MQPIILSRRVEVRALDIEVLQRREFLSDSEVFLRTELDISGYILGVSLGVGSVEDLKSNRIDWKAYATTNPDASPAEPIVTTRPRRAFDLRRTYESFATQLPAAVLGHRRPVEFAPSTPVGSRPDNAEISQQPGGSLVGASTPAPQRDVGLANTDHARAKPAGVPALRKSRSEAFPELAKAREYDAGHNIDDPKERLAYQANLAAARAFADGWQIEDICDRFSLNKLRLHRILHAHQDKGRDGLLMLQRRSKRAK